MKIDKELNINVERLEQTLLAEFINIFPEEKMIKIMKTNFQDRVLSNKISNELAVEILEEYLSDAVNQEKNSRKK